MEFAARNSHAVGERKVQPQLPNLRNLAEFPVTKALTLLTGHSPQSAPGDFAAFKEQYTRHVADGLDAVILVGFGQVVMHYAVGLIMLRGVPSRNIFIIDRSTNFGGCLYQANTFGWFGAPSNPFVFYPYALYGSCYSKMKFDPLGISSPCALANMYIVMEHFGLRVFLGTDWKDVEPLLHPTSHCVKPAYRDVISGRMAGAMNGVDALNLNAAMYHFVGMGSTVGDALVELVKRRVTSAGSNFKIKLHYRTPRRFTTYMGTLVQPPGVFPFYSSGPMSTLGLKIDQAILSNSKNKYPEMDRILHEYMKFEIQRQLRSESAPFSAIMNVLTYHPVVASKMIFNQIADKTDVTETETNTILDCTNAINYHFQSQDDVPTVRVDYAPNMLSSFPSRRQLFLGSVRTPGPLHGQWSTAQGAMGQILSPNAYCDVSSQVAGCVGQCYSVFYFAKFHLVPKFFLVFQFYPTSVQFLSVLLYEMLMRVLALTGFTLIFFDADAYRLVPHQSAKNNFGVIEARWAWFSDQTGYRGDDAQFPCPFDNLPGISSCFDFTWMLASRTKLRFRMCATLVVLVLAINWKLWSPFVSAQIAQIAQIAV